MTMESFMLDPRNVREGVRAAKAYSGCHYGSNRGAPHEFRPSMLLAKD